jgi:hypothetical protein
LRLSVLVILGGIAIDYVTKDQRIKKGKNLVGRGQQKRDQHKFPVLLRVSVEKFHRASREMRAV